MNPKKMNSTLWYSLGLVLLLCIAIPVLATGTAFARYRTNETHSVNFQVEEATKVYVGVIESENENLTFSTSEMLEWKNESGVSMLTFSVANGANTREHHDKDQRFRLRVIGGAGLWQENGTAKITLVLPPKEGSEEKITVEATAEPIGTDTLLYNRYGAGWVFTFLDENGEEIYWDLEGGEFSYVTITLKADVSGISSSVLLEPQISAEIIE